MSELIHLSASLPDRLDYAKALAAAGLLPDAFRQQPANVLLGMELAGALGLAPIVVINELAVIGGKPSFSAKFMRSLVRRAGHRLRESYTDGTARCVIIRADDPGYEHVAVWDEQKARDHAYWGKGHWQKNPALMLGNRALSECVRLACPEVLGGIAYTPDEVADFVPSARLEQVAYAPMSGPMGASIDKAADQAGIEFPTPPPAADPADMIAATLDGEVLISPDQTVQLAALMADLDLDKRQMLATVREITGRAIKSAADLTEVEADLVIANLATRTPEAEAVES